MSVLFIVIYVLLIIVWLATVFLLMKSLFKAKSIGKKISHIVISFFAISAIVFFISFYFFIKTNTSSSGEKSITPRTYTNY